MTVFPLGAHRGGGCCNPRRPVAHRATAGAHGHDLAAKPGDLGGMHRRIKADTLVADRCMIFQPCHRACNHGYNMVVGNHGSAAGDHWDMGGTDPVGEDPDVLAYDDGAHQLYVAADSGTVSTFDVQRHELTMSGSGISPQVVAVDPATHRSFYPIPAGTSGKPTLLQTRTELTRWETRMLSWGVIGYGAALSAVLSAVLAVVIAVRERRPWVLVSVAGALLGAVAWNAILRATRADQFFHDAPIPLFPVSWQDTGSGVLSVAVAAVLLGFGAMRADPARRLAVLAVLAGLAALLVDVYLY